MVFRAREVYNYEIGNMSNGIIPQIVIVEYLVTSSTAIGMDGNGAQQDVVQ